MMMGNEWTAELIVQRLPTTHLPKCMYVYRFIVVSFTEQFISNNYILVTYFQYKSIYSVHTHRGRTHKKLIKACKHGYPLEQNVYAV